MNKKKRILLKLTGEIFNKPSLVTTIIEQILALKTTHQFGIVIGGGNFFRGDIQGKQLDMDTNAAHSVGMLATIMNGLILQDSATRLNLKTSLFSAVPCPSLALPISPQTLRTALDQDDTLIFSGGIGSPFFTTDTTAVVRSLQINASALWKATHVDGIYTADPHKDTAADYIPRITFQEALDKHLAVMDRSAFVLADEHKKEIRIFNIFMHNALISAAENADFGSIIHS